MCGERMNRFCDFIDATFDEETLAPYLECVHVLMRNIGKALVLFVYFISAFLAFTSFFIIIPYEQLYKPTWLLITLSVFGLYFLLNIQYHYYKARTIPPVSNPGEEGDPLCHKCNYWKSEKTHHCSVCRTCVLGMDHHCIWINQCVGTHNHRHFFLFIANLTFAAATIILAGFPSFYDHIFMDTTQSTYCTTILDNAPLQDIICDHDGFSRTSIVFCYLLSGLLLLMVGGLTLWNVYLISIGCTHIDYLKLNGSRRKANARIRLNKGLRNNWKNFLGIRRNRTFFRCVVVPSSLPPITFEGSKSRENLFDVV